jgi:phosphinothricin acetyltransferase
LTEIQGFSIQPVGNEDGQQIIDIFNYYVENSFAAYPDDKAPYEFFDRFQQMAQGYPFLVAKSDDGIVLGFGLLRPHSQIPSFSSAAEITIFVSPTHRGGGVGWGIISALVSEARRLGITAVLASISSLNPESLKFHRKAGFIECGRFVGIGKKRGQQFDVVWMQKNL